jgi:hypothetical protein
MRFLKHSIDYQINMEAFHEMEDCVPMTRKERSALCSWVKQGYDIETNPWEFTDSDGWPLNYLRAYRLHHGYSSGPWDEWRGPEDEMMWDISTKSIIPGENFD